MKKTTTASRNNKVVAKTTVKKSVSKTATKKTATRTLTTEYTPISNNIYHVGRRYRVRVSIKGVRYDQYFTSKKAAFAYRKELLATR